MRDGEDLWETGKDITSTIMSSEDIHNSHFYKGDKARGSINFIKIEKKDKTLENMRAKDNPKDFYYRVSGRIGTEVYVVNALENNGEYFLSKGRYFAPTEERIGTKNNFNDADRICYFHAKKLAKFIWEKYAKKRLINPKKIIDKTYWADQMDLFEGEEDQIEDEEKNTKIRHKYLVDKLAFSLVEISIFDNSLKTFKERNAKLIAEKTGEDAEKHSDFISKGIKGFNQLINEKIDNYKESYFKCKETDLDITYLMENFSETVKKYDLPGKNKNEN